MEIMKKYCNRLISILVVLAVIAAGFTGCSDGGGIDLTINIESETVTEKDQIVAGNFSPNSNVVSVSYSVRHNKDADVADSGEAQITNNNFSFKTHLLLGKNTVTVNAITEDEKIYSEEVTITYDSGTPYKLNVNAISTDAETGTEYVNNIVMIFLKDGVTEQRKNEIVDSINGRIVGNAYSINEIDVEIPSTDLSILKTICAELEQNSEVDKAFYDTVSYVYPDISINDPYKDADGGDWYLEAIDAYGAWDYNDRFSEINIGICDTGFDTGHEDLDEKINFPSEWLESINEKDDHGTHVAGIIGAVANNEKGMAGLSWKSNLYCIDWEPTEEQSNNGLGWNTDARVLCSLRYAVESGCKAVNYSLGKSGGLPNGYTEFDQTALDREGSLASYFIARLLEENYDFVVVQSSGNGTSGKNDPNNENENCDPKQVLAIDAKNNCLFCSVTEDNILLPKDSKITKEDILNRIIIVGNAEKLDDGTYQQAVSSNGGSQVDICAPGTNIYSTVPGSILDGLGSWINGGYENKSGTSMAAPMVTAVCGMVWSVNDSFTGAEVKDIVCGSYDENIWVNDNTDSKHTTADRYRMLNAKLAVQEAVRKTDNAENDNNTSNNLQTDLLNYYWFNNIQSPCVYEFKDDNTVIEYWGSPYEPKSNWVLSSDTIKYEFNNNELTLYFKSDYTASTYVHELNYVSLKEDIAWDTGLHLEEIIKDNEYFFYEVDFKPASYGPAGNAFYLKKGINKDESNNFAANNSIYDAYLEQIEKAVEKVKQESGYDSVNAMFDPTYTVYDMNNDGIKELILETGTCEADYTYEFYTYRDGLILLGEAHAGHSGLYIPDDSDGLYLHYCPPPGDICYVSLYKLTIDSEHLSQQTIYKNKGMSLEERDAFSDQYQYLDEFYASDLSKLKEVTER